MSKQLEPIPPGEVLQEEFLVPLGISQNQLARDIDVPVSRIAGIVKGERAITADTALRLAACLGTSPEMWLRLQSEYDLRKAKQTTWPAVEPRIRVYNPTSAATRPAQSSHSRKTARGSARRPGARSARFT